MEGHLGRARVHILKTEGEALRREKDKEQKNAARRSTFEIGSKTTPYV